MFNGCSSLTSAPELPATNLAYECYKCMFQDCTSLTSAPELPVTNLAHSCYYGMFYGCSSLVNAPELPATNLAEDCYSYMFADCTSLTSVNVGFTNWSSNGTYDWFYNVPSVGTFVCPEELPIQYGKSYIPNGWTVKTFKL